MIWFAYLVSGHNSMTHYVTSPMQISSAYTGYDKKKLVQEKMFFKYYNSQTFIIVVFSVYVTSSEGWWRDKTWTISILSLFFITQYWLCTDLATHPGKQKTERLHTRIQAIAANAVATLPSTTLIKDVRTLLPAWLSYHKSSVVFYMSLCCWPPRDINMLVGRC